MADSWVLYPDLRDRMIALVMALPPEELDRTVPLTPAWTVREVTAHVCGLNGHILSLGWKDLGSDEATSAQVAAHEGRSIGEVCADWAGYDDALRSRLTEIPFGQERLAGDLVIHLHDVLAALGREIDRTDDATASAAHIYASRSVDRWAEIVGVSVRIELSDGFSAGGPSADVVLRATPYDFLRSVAGRRSRRQVEALDWSDELGGTASDTSSGTASGTANGTASGTASRVIDHFSPYTELGSVDAPV